MDRFEAAARSTYICFRYAGGKLIIVKRLWAFINNNNNSNLYLSVKAKIAVTEPLNGDTISEIYIYILYIYISI